MIKMPKTEQRAAFSLSSIMALRMMGIFMVIPLLSLYSDQLLHATPFLTGLTIGIYGLSQCLLQVPFGSLSDRIGRKPIILAGLLLFISGSLICAGTESIYGMILGRLMQGAGAVGSTLLAFIADLTSREQRTKAMAIAGMTIGLSFAVAMMMGPLIANWLSVPALFLLAALMGAVGILLLYTWVPSSSHAVWHPETEPDIHQVSSLLKDPRLKRLYVSIFFSHVIFSATFVALPISLQQMAGLNAAEQGWLYLPVMFGAFLISIGLLLHAEKSKQVPRYFLAGVILLGVAELLFAIFARDLFLSAFSLLLFLIAFSLLEAFLPSMVSKLAPPAKKGTVLGIYSSSQFFGIFVGGVMGGWLYGQFGLISVYSFCVILCVSWVTMTTRLFK